MLGLSPMDPQQVLLSSAHAENRFGVEHGWNGKNTAAVAGR
jgi:hypothetical protein